MPAYERDNRSGPIAGANPRIGPVAEPGPKNRAENLMILDLIRNDLGRIAQPGQCFGARELCRSPLSDTAADGVDGDRSIIYRATR